VRRARDRVQGRSGARVIRPILLFLLLVGAACAPDSAAPAASSADRIELELEGGSKIVLPRAPRRVLPANTAAVEYVCTLIGPDRVAALPEQADRYSELDLGALGFGSVPRFDRFHAEPLIVLAPDLVLTHAWQAAETSEVLRAQGIAVLSLPSARSWADVRATIALLGRALAVEPAAARVIAGLDARVEQLAAGARSRPPLRALVYSNDGTGGWAAGRATTADALLGLCGLRNSAAEAGIEGHAALDLERLIGIDPDLFVVAKPARGEGGSATEGVLLATTALASLRAVRERRIAVLSAALISADSPEIVDAAEALARELERLHADGFAPAERK
jgi:ABC-type Fe3+-hydroxamate transport system substrate-binding protein